MQSSTAKLKLVLLTLLLVAIGVFVASCGGSKANVRKEESTATAEPVAVISMDKYLPGQRPPEAAAQTGQNLSVSQ